jgi:hypothetical protein
MFRSRAEPVATKMSRRAGRWLWIIAGLDAVVLAWMAALGSWLDRCAGLCRVATLGGHHVLVMLLASVGLIMLIALAFLTEGFTKATSDQAAALAVACMLSVLAVAGPLSLFFVGLLVLSLWMRMHGHGLFR